MMGGMMQVMKQDGLKTMITREKLFQNGLIDGLKFVILEKKIILKLLFSYNQF